MNVGDLEFPVANGDIIGAPVEGTADGGDAEIAETAAFRSDARVAPVTLQSSSIESLAETFDGVPHRRGIGDEENNVA